MDQLGNSERFTGEVGLKPCADSCGSILATGLGVGSLSYVALKHFRAGRHGIIPSDEEAAPLRPNFTRVCVECKMLNYLMLSDSPGYFHS
jgi:hypothetical protein